MSVGYFPFYVDIKGKSCVIVGGGKVALRKLEKLIPFEPSITVVAPQICGEILAYKNIIVHKREFEDSDILNAFMVIAASSSEEINSRVFNLCKTNSILVNTVDDRDKCTFIFPALVKTENITVGISTSGKSPLYAKLLREEIEELADSKSDKAVETLWRYRDVVKREVPSEENRKLAFERIASLCGDNIDADDDAVMNIIEDLR